MKYLILIMFSQITFADFICDTQTAIRHESEYQICGVGEDHKESEARLTALNNAVKAFNIVCNLSTDCKGKNRTIIPGRTDCNVLNPSKGSSYLMYWKCTMLLNVLIY